MKLAITNIRLEIFPETKRYDSHCASVTITRRNPDPLSDDIRREYEYLTQSSYNRVVRCQQHFMYWNAFNKGLHKMGHISKWS